MRIPTSLIVMSLLTAAPFGLAIYDQQGKRPAEASVAYGPEDEARRDRERLAEFEAEAAREAAEHENANAVRLAKLDTVFGTGTASLGSLFGGARIGAPIPTALPDLLGAATREGFLLPSFQQTDATLASIHVEVVERDNLDACQKLRAKLVATWGPSSRGVWLDPATHSRATLTTGPLCTLTYDRYLDVPEWLANVPLDVVGQASDISDSSFPGLGAGTGVTTLVVEKHTNGKVARVTVTGSADFDTIVRLRDTLSDQLHEQATRDSYTDGWAWKKKPGFSLWQSHGTDRFTLQFGTFPE